MSNNLPATTDGADIMAAVITKGDLSKLDAAERVAYYGATCKSLGLNPLTKPFDYLTLSGKTVLYATKTAADQLRKINGVSIVAVEKEVFDGVLMVTATARDASGREDTEIGAVNIANLKGDALANAYMKALTKAKRRVTLSICGLGFLDETEVETIPHARPVVVDADGVIQDDPQTPQIAPQATKELPAWDQAFYAAKRADIAPESLYEYFTVRGYQDGRVPDDILLKFARWCDSHNRREIQQHIRDTISKSQDRPEPEPSGMDDEDYQQVVASINAGAASESMSAAEAADRWTR